MAGHDVQPRLPGRAGPGVQGEQPAATPSRCCTRPGLVKTVNRHRVNDGGSGRTTAIGSGGVGCPPSGRTEEVFAGERRAGSRSGGRRFVADDLLAQPGAVLVDVVPEVGRAAVRAGDQHSSGMPARRTPRRRTRARCARALLPCWRCGACGYDFCDCVLGIELRDLRFLVIDPAWKGSSFRGACGDGATPVKSQSAPCRRHAPRLVRYPIGLRHRLGRGRRARPAPAGADARASPTCAGVIPMPREAEPTACRPPRPSVRLQALVGEPEGSPRNRARHGWRA